MKKNIQPHRLNPIIKIPAIIIGLFIILSLVLMLRFWIANISTHEQIGVSFSQAQAERFGSDWQSNYTALFDELGFRHIRVAAYWDRIEPQPGQYDFSQTDWMVEQAKQRGAKLTMVIGQKSLRVPECYYPTWLDKNDTEKVHHESMKMLRAVVEHYHDESTIETWQLENEFLLRSFGDCPKENLTSANLADELRLVKSLDMSRPVILTQSDQMGFPILGPFANLYGFSMYRWVWGPLGYYRYPQSGIYNWWKASIISFFTGQTIKVHELQAEAWDKVGNEHLDPARSFATMNPKQLNENIEYARQTQIKKYDLWGAEWWYWLKQNGHPQMWEAIRALPNKD